MLNTQDCEKQKWSELSFEFKPKKCGSLLQYHTTDGEKKVHQILYSLRVLLQQWTQWR